MMGVIVYTTPVCPYCRMVKQFLRSNGISFIEKDASSDAEAIKLLSSKGFNSVPVTQVGDLFISGFNEESLRKALGLKS